ncbi:MAG: ABC transporter permease [Trueperaceae bacterium]|nr:ABC transporter permease [Trueperaceae bacterium]
MEINQGKLARDMLIRRLGNFGLLLSPIVSYFFLWAPIVVLIVFSFNDAASVSVWRGFTFKWYQQIFAAGSGDASFVTEKLLEALGNSLFVSLTASLLATTIGTMLAIAIHRGNFPGRRIIDGLLYVPVVIPEITQGVSLAIFFRIIFEYVQTMTGQRLTPGFATIIIAHVAFNISYVVIVVRARLATMNTNYEEAARDLGANNFQTFWRITFPLLLPGILAGGLLALTLSLDDFVVTFFTKGVGDDTLPIFVYGMLKQRVSPEINAISTLMILASTVLIGFSLILQQRGTND